MALTQVNKPIKLNLDKTKKYLAEDESFYLLNHERYVNASSILGKTTALTGNYHACIMDVPEGDNYCIGTYRSPKTNEVYSFHHNSNALHYILRISGNGSCDLVYANTAESKCLNFSADPKHAITDWRVYLRYEKATNCPGQMLKQIIWVDGNEEIGMLDVEASIATNSFSTSFFNECQDACDLVRMCVPQPCGCLSGEFVPRTVEDELLTNAIVDKGFKVAFRHIYYDNRASEWSDISSLYYKGKSGGCFEDERFIPRCIKFRVPVGSPMVDRIEFAFTTDNGFTWQRAHTIEKYIQSDKSWYERELNIKEMSTFSASDCSVDYVFCNDEECTVLDPTQFTRVFNPQPRKPQGLLAMPKDTLGFYNYEQGTCPVDKKEISKIKVTPNCDTDKCSSDYVAVVVRAIIYDPSGSTGITQPVYYRMGEDGQALTDRVWYGGVTLTENHAGIHIELGDDQYFRGKFKNFVAYIEGSNVFGEMRQYTAQHGFTNPSPVGVINSDRITSAYNENRFYYQEHTFLVPKGTGGFIRMAGHREEEFNPESSTHVFGVASHIKEVNWYNVGYKRANVFEVYFDTCGISGNTLVLEDFFVITAYNTFQLSYDGYVTDNLDYPVEGALIDVPRHDEEIITDHNGFFHFGDTHLSASVGVLVELYSCEAGYEGATGYEMSFGKLNAATSHNFILPQDSYASNMFTRLKAKVVDCDGNPVGGVIVAVSGSKFGMTDNTGVAEMRIRNYPSAYHASSEPRTVRVVVMDKNGCFIGDCDGGCAPCMPTGSLTLEPCFVNIPEELIEAAPAINVKMLRNSAGLKAGGRYGWAGVVKWDCGQISAANEISFMDVPKTQEKGALGFCSFDYDATGVQFPVGASCLQIVRTENQNPYELQWVVDDIKRKNGKIVLTIQSLNDYNSGYFFKTNSVYKFLVGDRVEFVRNGDGKLFTKNLNYLTISPFYDKTVDTRTDPPADYFNQLLIEDDDKLADLKPGAIIEMQRAKACKDQPTYFEICASIPIGDDGKLIVPKGNFITFDTYLVTRNIGTVGTFTFEHHSPSDFWGEKLSDIGKPHFVNRYETQRRYGRNITLNASGQYNYFGMFEKTFDAPEQGDIIAMSIVDAKVILAIGEHDNFLAQAADDLARVGNDGVLRAIPEEAVISSPDVKLRGAYGCQYPHIGSILFGDGWATWVDVNKHTLVKHDYSQAKALDDGKANVYFRKRCQQLESDNRKNPAGQPYDLYRFVAGYNYYTGASQLTIKQLKNGGINNEKKPFQLPNETILFHPDSEDFLTFASYTPEAYTHVDLFDGGGCAMILFLNSLPYIHPVVPDRFNEFFGVAVDRVIGVTINKYANKIKRALAMEIQDGIMWFSPEITTDKVNFISEIPPIKFKKDKGKWNAAFLCDKNSRGGLFGNSVYGAEHTEGYEINVTLVRDNTDSLKYETINDAKRILNDELDLVLFRFQVLEQSGFNEEK